MRRRGWVVWLCADPAQVSEPDEVVGRYPTEREARRAAAAAIGCRSLRGLARVPAPRGTRYYAPGAGDEAGASVEIGGVRP